MPYLEINVNLLTSERYVTAWEEQKLVLTNRLKMNIDNGFFETVMQHPEDYITHTHDGTVPNAYTNTRKLSSLATDTATVGNPPLL